MPRIQSFIFLCFCLLILGCKDLQNEEPSNTSIKSIHYAKGLLGSWENVRDNEKLIEKWHEVSDSVISGLSYQVSNNDTITLEEMNLEQHGKDLFFIAKATNQNNDLPISFRAIQADEHTLVFENAEHDFPQRITYTFVNEDSIFAEISGSIQGEKKSIPFPYKRRKEVIQ